VSGDLISAGGLNIIVGVGFIRPEQLAVGGGILGRRKPSSLKQVGFIRPVRLVNADGLDKSSPYKESADLSDPRQFCTRRWDIREEVSLLPKDGCGLDESSPYRFLLDAGESPSPKWSPIKGEEKKNN